MGSANKRAGPTVCGVLVVDKPVGPTSMDAVAIVRRKAGGARTGHAGTLDPLAEGVLVVGLGAATKSLGRLMATSKRYRTAIDLSAFTSTDDREGARQEVAVPAPPDLAAVRAVIDALTGSIMQRPPVRSAVKVGGRRAYELSRRGHTVELKARPVEVHRLEVLRYEWPMLELDVHCGKGVYVRSLARDIGLALGTGGHCTTLRRTAQGPFAQEEARPLDELPDPLGDEHLMTVEAALARVEAGA